GGRCPRASQGSRGSPPAAPGEGSRRASDATPCGPRYFTVPGGSRAARNRLSGRPHPADNVPVAGDRGTARGDEGRDRGTAPLREGRGGGDSPRGRGGRGPRDRALRTGGGPVVRAARVP